MGAQRLVIDSIVEEEIRAEIVGGKWFGCRLLAFYYYFPVLRPMAPHGDDSGLAEYTLRRFNGQASCRSRAREGDMTF